MAILGPVINSVQMDAFSILVYRADLTWSTWTLKVFVLLTKKKTCRFDELGFAS